MLRSLNTRSTLSLTLSWSKKMKKNLISLFLSSLLLASRRGLQVGWNKDIFEVIRSKRQPINWESARCNFNIRDICRLGKMSTRWNKIKLGLASCAGRWSHKHSGCQLQEGICTIETNKVKSSTEILIDVLLCFCYLTKHNFWWLKLLETSFQGPLMMGTLIANFRLDENRLSWPTVSR